MERQKTKLMRRDSKIDKPDQNNNNAQRRMSIQTRLKQPLKVNTSLTAGNMYSDKTESARLRSMRQKKLAISLIPAEEFIDSVPLRMPKEYTILRLSDTDKAKISAALNLNSETIDDEN